MRFNLHYFTVLVLSKKINTVNAVKVFFYYELEKSIIQIKDLFYHSFRLNAAELLILYERMIVLDPKIVNLL